MNSALLVVVILFLLLLVAVLKMAWSRSVARSWRPRSDAAAAENDWDAVQQHGYRHDGGWGSSHHSDSSYGHTSDADSSDSNSGGGDGGGGDSSSD